MPTNVFKKEHKHILNKYYKLRPDLRYLDKNETLFVNLDFMNGLRKKENLYFYKLILFLVVYYKFDIFRL